MILMTATNARKKVEKFYHLESQNQLKAVAKKINLAAIAGNSYINFELPLLEETIFVLEKKGYTVKRIHYSRFYISWK